MMFPFSGPPKTAAEYRQTAFLHEKDIPSVDPFSLRPNGNGIRPFQSLRDWNGRMLPTDTFSYGLRIYCADLAEQ